MTIKSSFFFNKPQIGIGTWRIGEKSANQSSEVDAIIFALEIGYRIIDTAELYADGNSEKVVGKAIKNFGFNQRENLAVVSKVLPSNASSYGVVKSCEDSLRRLNLDYLDQYLLHWQGNFSFEETLEGFVKLKEMGKILSWGVSNFDIEPLKKWLNTELKMGLNDSCKSNQIHYSLNARNSEYSLIPFMDQNGISVMAYTPLESGNLNNHKKLTAFALDSGFTAGQIALAWSIRNKNVVSIPKSSKKEHIYENFNALKVDFKKSDLTYLNLLFTPPNKKNPLSII